MCHKSEGLFGKSRIFEIELTQLDPNEIELIQLYSFTKDYLLFFHSIKKLRTYSKSSIGKFVVCQKVTWADLLKRKNQNTYLFEKSYPSYISKRRHVLELIHSSIFEPEIKSKAL